MKKNSLINYNLSPDSLTGSISAIEGIKDAIALVNGPTGCRIVNAYMIYNQDKFVDYTADVSMLSDDFFLHQFRVPSTYLDEFDFIFSTEPKLIKILQRIDSNNYYKLIGVINTSATALIGDDIEKIILKSGFSKDFIVIESTGFVENIYLGFQKTLINIIEKLFSKNRLINKKYCFRKKTITKPNNNLINNCVNLIGFSLSQYNWFNDATELKLLLNSIGINVNIILCVDTSYKSLLDIPKADLNIVISEEYGSLLAEYFKENFGIPFLGLSKDIDEYLEVFTPIGFTFIEDFIEKISYQFKINKTDYKLARDRAKRRIFKALQGISGTRSVLKGLKFAIFADSYILYPMLRFLYEYLGLYPKIIGLKSIDCINTEKIKKYLEEKKLCTTILQYYNQLDIKKAFEVLEPDIIFGSAVEKNIMRLIKKNFAYINISLPEDYKTVLTHRPLMGINGVLTIVEELINNIKVINYNNYL